MVVVSPPSHLGLVTGRTYTEKLADRWTKWTQLRENQCPITGRVWHLGHWKSPKSLTISFSRMDSGLCMYHLFVWSNLNLHNSQWITFPTQSCLVILFLRPLTAFAYYVIDRFISIPTQPKSAILLCLVYFWFDIVSPYGVVLRCNQKWFSFFLNSSLSYPCSSFLVWDFACLSLEISIWLFFFPFLFSGYFCSVYAYVVCIVFTRCNQSSSTFFNVVFKSLYRCIDAIFYASESSASFFSWHITVCLRHVWDVRSDASSWIYLFSGLLVSVLSSSPSRIVLSILQEGYPRHLSLWWDLCNIIWFRLVSSYSWYTLF